MQNLLSYLIALGDIRGGSPFLLQLGHGGDQGIVAALGRIVGLLTRRHHSVQLVLRRIELSNSLSIFFATLIE